MKLIFDKSFSKSIDKLNDKSVKEKIEQIIIEIESVNSLSEISNVKKMQVLNLTIASGLVITESVLNLKTQQPFALSRYYIERNL